MEAICTQCVRAVQTFTLMSFGRCQYLPAAPNYHIVIKGQVSQWGNP